MRRLHCFAFGPAHLAAPPLLARFESNDTIAVRRRGLLAEDAAAASVEATVVRRVAEEQCVGDAQARMVVRQVWRWASKRETCARWKRTTHRCRCDLVCVRWCVCDV